MKLFLILILLYIEIYLTDGFAVLEEIDLELNDFALTVINLNFMFL